MLAILLIVTVVIVAVALVYFSRNRYRRKSREQLIQYDATYNYELPTLLQRMDSENHDATSNDSENRQPHGYTQSKFPESKPILPDSTPVSPESKPVLPVIKPVSPDSKPASPDSKPALPDSKPVSPDSEISSAANSCLNNSPLGDENGNVAVNDNPISQFPSTNLDTAKPLSVHSVGTDSPSEGADLTLNLAIDIVENLSDEPRTPSPNIDEKVSYQSSTRFSLERNPAYKNIAYEHMISSSQPLATNPDAVVSAKHSPIRSVEIDLSLERAEGTDPPLNLEVREATDKSTAENTDDELRMSSPDVEVHKNVLHQLSTSFNLDRDFVCRTTT